MEQNSNPSQGQGLWDASPKVTFALGLVSGIAVMSVVGLLLVLNFVLSSRSLPALAATGNGAQQVAQQPSDTLAVDEGEQIPSLPPKDIDEKRDHIWGNKDAKLTLIEYSDFECPYCASHVETMKKIKETYKNDIRVVFRHFPLSFHPQAQKAAEASECAADQNKFWEMHDKLFALNTAGQMSLDSFKKAAQELGLNTDKFNKCLDSGDKAARVAEDLNEGSGAGVGGTPATFVDGELVSGAVPYESFKAIVDAALATK